MFVLLLFLSFFIPCLAQAEPTPTQTVTPVVWDGRILTEHTQSFLLPKSNEVTPFYFSALPLSQAKIIWASVMNDEGKKFACNIGQDGSETNRKGGTRYFYNISETAILYYKGSACRLTVTWWE